MIYYYYSYKTMILQTDISYFSKKPQFDEIDKTTSTQSNINKIIYSISNKILPSLEYSLILGSSTLLQTLSLKTILSTLTVTVISIFLLFKTSNLGRGKPIDELENYQYSENQRSPYSLIPFQTVQIRAFASIEVTLDVKEVKQEVCHLLTRSHDKKLHSIQKKDFLNTPLSQFTASQINDVLGYYGINLSPQKLSLILKTETISKLIKIIITNKKEGMISKEYFGCMTKLLTSFLKNFKTSLTESQRVILESFKAQTENLLKYSKKLSIIQNSFYSHKAKPNNTYLKKQLASQIESFVITTIKNIETHHSEQIGYLFEGGWKGHFTHTEIRKVKEKYIIHIANAGEGVNNFHRKAPAQNQDPTPHYVIIKTFEVENKEELKKVLTKLVTASTRPENKKIVSKNEYYSSFEGLKEIIYKEMPARPIQRVGNCGFRNQEELLFWILQRNEEIDLANTLQEHIISIYQNYPHLYPALKKGLEKQIAAIENKLLKPPISSFDINNFYYKAVA